MTGDRLHLDHPSIDAYDCYRTFLRDWFQARKAQDPRFSHRQFARRAGFTSSALVPLLVQGKRNLTPRYLAGFIRALGLSPRESAYFRVLIDFTHARTDAERRTLDSQLRTLRAKGPTRIEAARSRFFETWVHVALHQAMSCLDVADDLAVVRDFLDPSPSLEDLRTSLRVLVDLKLVRKDDRGFWRPTDDNLLSDSPIAQWVLRGFREQMILLGNTAHERHAPDRFHTMSETLALSADAAQRIGARFQEFRREVVQIALEDPLPATGILQLNLQLFPLSREVRP